MDRILNDRIDIAEEILRLTCQPGLSMGVIHQGREVCNHHFGVIDIDSGRKPDGDTLYCVASLSKAFIVASLDLLVQESKFSWDSTIASIIPGFKRDNMTLRDICSHHTGLISLDEITQGLNGRILIQKDDVIAVSNALPRKFDLRSNFLYNNALYALAACIIEHTSDHSNWGDFLSDRLFKPLGMTRTTAFSSIHKTDSNITTPYMILSDGTPSEIAPTELSADSMNGGSGGIRSSLNDMLKWCSCLLKSFHGEDTGADSLVRSGSPMYNRTAIVNSESTEEGDYCMGWCHNQTPSKLGLISPNRALESPLLGVKSPSLLILGHQGDVGGYTCSIYLIPKSNSAIVILSNGTGLSDATDWIAQDLIQTMHGLQPNIDFVDVATRATTEYLAHYEKDFKRPLEENRECNTRRPPLEDFIGFYTMEGLDIVSLDVTMDPKDATRLLMTVNKQHDQVYGMWHYHHDVWCHLPGSFDSCLARGLDRKTWSSFLTSFIRDSSDNVSGLCWKLEEVDVMFTKT